MRYYLIIFLLALITTGNNLYGNCGSSSCPLYVNRPLSRGLLALSLSHEYIYQDQVYVGSNKSFIGAIPDNHDEVSTLNEITSFSLGYNPFDFLSLNFKIPFVHREHNHIHNNNDEKEWEHWNFGGIGDAVLSGNFSIINSTGENNKSISLLAGIKLPTGITNVKNEEGEEAEVTIQPGTGSTDFIIGAAYTQNITTFSTMVDSLYSALPLAVSASYKINGKGTDDYKIGNEFLLHVSTAYRFARSVSLLLQVNARFQDYGNPGATDESYFNTGGKWIFLSPGLNFYLSGDISIYGYIQIPVYQKVNGIQLAAPYNLQFGISKEMNLLE